MQRQANQETTSMQTEADREQGLGRPLPAERSGSVEDTERLQAQREEHRARYLDSERQYTARLEGTLHRRREENARLQEDVVRLGAEKEELRKDRDAWKGMFQALKPVQEAQRTRMNQLQERIKVVETERDAARGSYHRVEDEKSSLDKSVKAVSAERERYRADIQGMLEQLAEGKKERAEAEVKLRAATSNIQDLQDRLRDFQGRVESLQATSTIQQSKIAILDDTVNQTTSEYDALRTEAHSTTVRLAQTQRANVSAGKVICSLRAEMDMLRSQLAELANNHEELEVERDEWIAEATRQNRSARQQLALNQTLSGTIKRLEQDLQMKDRVKDIEVAEMGRKLLEMGTRLSTTSSDARGRIHVETGEAQGESLHNTLVVVVPVLGHSGHGSQSVDYPLNEEEEQDGQPRTPLLDSELRAIIERRIIDDATLRETNERLQGELEGVYQERSDLAAQLSARYGQPIPSPETENRTAVAAVAQSGSTSLKYCEYENFIPRPEPSTWSVGLTSSRLVD